MNHSRKIFLGLAVVLLALHLLTFPRAPFNTTHDSSSTASFEYYAAKKVQFGTELYQNIGPYGYVLYSDDYGGYLHWQKVGLKTFSRLALLVMICWMIVALKQSLARFCWYAGFFLFYSFGDVSNLDYLDLHDNYAYLTIYLLALWLLQNRNDRLFRFLSVAGWCFLTFISLNKISFFVVLCVIALAVLAQNLYRRNFVNAILGLVAGAVSLGLNWILAGQHAGNLPEFIRGVFTLSSCYNEALAMKTPVFPLLFGVAVLTLLGGGIIVNWWRRKPEFGRAAIECFLLYVIWKHGFVRSDEHMLIFFYAALLMVIPVFYYDPDHGNYECPLKRKLLTAGCCLAIYGFCLISFYAIIHNCHYKPVRLVRHLRDNISWLVAPFEKTRALELRLVETKSAFSLPKVKNSVGQASIDFFGFEPGHLLLNDLNYTSRPMPTTFAAANRYLQEANERFYRDPLKAPAFVLCQSGGIDNRLFIQDDALAKRALLDNYRPVFIENGLLLFKRREAFDTVPSRHDTIPDDQVINFGQTISLGKMNESVVWLEVKVEHTWAGKFVSLLYKTPQCTIGVQFDGEEQLHFHKFVTSMGDCGFIINPYLQNNPELADFFDHRKKIRDFVRVSAISFKYNKWDKLFFKDKIHLRWRLLERPKP